MKLLVLGLAVILLTLGCASWGDYVYKSDRFNFKVTFPDKWTVFDRSTDSEDHLDAEYPGVTAAQMSILAYPSAPDISPNEIYPSFMDAGGDAAILTEFNIVTKGAVSCRNREGRQITYTYLTDEQRIKGMRVLFIGERFIITIKIEMPSDAFADQEPEFNKMISMLEL
jgi:hypothetical protein